ncbi:hypothetical protein GN956_G9762 [Arapaima gigas]
MLTDRKRISFSLSPQSTGIARLLSAGLCGQSEQDDRVSCFHSSQSEHRTVVALRYNGEDSSCYGRVTDSPSAESERGTAAEKPVQKAAEKAAQQEGVQGFCKL